MVRFWRTAQRRVCFKNKKGCRTALLLLLLFQEPLKEDNYLFQEKEETQSDKWQVTRFCFRKEMVLFFFCLFQEPLVSRIQRRPGFVSRKRRNTMLVSRKEGLSFLVLLFKKTRFCLFISRKEGFVSRTRRAAASCLFQEPRAACFKNKKGCR